MSVVEIIERAAARFSTREFLTELRLGSAGQSASLTYAEVYERSLRLASGMARAGLRPGDRLAVLMDNGADMVTSEWACLLTGYLWVALNTRSSSAELEEVLADSRPAVLIVGSAYAGTVAAMSLPKSCRVVGAGAEPEGL